MGSKDFSIAFLLFKLRERIRIDFVILRGLQIVDCFFFDLFPFFTYVVFPSKRLPLFKQV